MWTECNSVLIFAISATHKVKERFKKRRCRTNTRRCTHLTRYQGNKALSWAVIPKPDSWQQVARSCSRCSLQGNRTAGRAECPEAGGECGKGNSRSFEGSVQRSRRSVGKTFRVVSRARTVVKKTVRGQRLFLLSEIERSWTKCFHHEEHEDTKEIKLKDLHAKKANILLSSLNSCKRQLLYYCLATPAKVAT